MDKIKIGIIGTGVGIRTHLKGFRNFSDDAIIYAIAGSSEERSIEFAKEYDIPVACKDYKELCDIDDIDLVCITTPNNFHKDMLLYAVSKNKNIICEKPMVNTMEEAEEIERIVKDYNKILIIDHQLRFNPYIIEIKKLINNGTLGKIYNVRLNQQGTGFANPSANWSWSFSDKDGGGVRLAMASHFTDLIEYWFGERDIVSITASMNPITKERMGQKVNTSTTVNAFIKLKDELTIEYSINAGSYIGSRFDITVFGDKGELTFTLQDKLKLYLRSSIGEAMVITPEGVYQDELDNKVSIFSGSFRYLAPKIIKAIKENSNEYINIASTPKDSIYSLKILDAIKESSNKGTSVIFEEEENTYF